MKQKYRLLRDTARALRLYAKFKHTEFGSQDKLKAYQAEKLRGLVSHAVEHSPYLSHLYRDIDTSGNFQLEDFPVVNKRMMMENFNEWITDSRLDLSAIERHIATGSEEQYYLDEYRIIATSGSTGLRGIFVYDRREWSVVMAAALRWGDMFGVSPLELTHSKLATVLAGSPIHATSRLAQSLNLGIRNILVLDTTLPLHNLVDSLNEFQPKLLMGYASIITLLAIEQIEGRLDINPVMLATFSEMLGTERVERVQEAWGTTPYNHYGSAEQVMIAADCDAHSGLHHFADMSIVEVVDSENNPVPPGVPGQKVLLTNLHNFTQPLIRYELSDMITKAEGICTCKRSFPRFSSIAGRTEDIIHLYNRDGESISISPVLIQSCLLEHAEVIEFQYSTAPNMLTFRVVPRKGTDTEALSNHLTQAMGEMLTKQGAIDITIHIQFVDKIERTDETMGKLKISMK